MTKSLKRRRGRSSTRIAKKIRSFRAQHRSDSTNLAYNSAWRDFVSWCEQNHANSLPADPPTVVDYLIAQAEAGRRRSTIQAKCVAIGAKHDEAGCVDPTNHPTVATTLAGIRNALDEMPTGKSPITGDALRGIISHLPNNLVGKRDLALILIGLAGAFRRSDLVGLDVDDLVVEPKLDTTRRPSAIPGTHTQGKSDSGGNILDLDTSAALRDWLSSADIKSGPLFRKIDRWGNVRAERLTAQSVALILKRAAKSAGLDPRQFSGRSLRSGLVTSPNNSR